MKADQKTWNYFYAISWTRAAWVKTRNPYQQTIVITNITLYYDPSFKNASNDLKKIGPHF